MSASELDGSPPAAGNPHRDGGARVADQQRMQRSAKGSRKIVIIYSRRDARICEELDPYLSPLERQHRIDRFDDTGISPDRPWQEEIMSTLNSAEVAILLVSQRFLSSPFILGEELPPLLRRAAQGGVTILSLILTPCAFEQTGFLSKYQTVNDPSHPLSGMRRHNRDAVYDRLAAILRDTLR